jgi:hypothetical protein
MKENNSKHWAIGCKIVQWRYNTQEHRTLKDTAYHLTFGQHPCVGISNIPIAPDILNKLSTESELIDLYSNLKSNLRFESPTTEKTLEPASEEEEIVAEEPVVASTKVSGTKRSYTTTPDSLAITRARKEAREDAVLTLTPAPAKASNAVKGTINKLDISSIRWMELHNQQNGKEVLLTDLIGLRLGASFAIIR